MSLVNYQIQNYRFALENRGGVFAPSDHGQFYAAYVQTQPGERVIDIGCGSGILSVLAAIQGAEVCATDIAAEATRLTAHNADLNGVRVDTQQGGFFADFKGPFDLILANLPQEIVPSEHAQQLGASAAEIDGGQRGNDLLLALLEQAPDYMHASSRLVLPLHTLSDYQHSLQFALQYFDVRLLAIGDLAAKPFVIEHLDFYKGHAQQGTIRLFNQHDQWYTNIYVIELRRKSG